jgi:hypothetical protein
LANTGPVLANGFSRQHPPRPPLELLRPKGANHCRVISGGYLEAGQQLSSHIGAISFGPRKRFSKQSHSLIGHG